jgi:hypothetical protein
MVDGAEYADLTALSEGRGWRATARTLDFGVPAFARTDAETADPKIGGPRYLLTAVQERSGRDARTTKLAAATL